MPKILVIGSSNTDMVVRADRLPRPGETVLGGTFFMNPGGKGANQAVAAARLGGQVAFVCKTGDDLFGSEARRLFREEGIDTSHLLTDPSAPSGVALITVDRQAENCIVVAPGANANLTPDDLRRAASAFEQADIVLLQLEIPMETVEQAALTACATGKRVVLNPAPATAIPARLLAALDLITPNETEAEAITGIRIADRRTADEAARRLAATGAKQVVITLGAQGALVYEAGQSRIVEGYPCGRSIRPLPATYSTERSSWRSPRESRSKKPPASPAKPPQSPSPTPERRDRSPRAPRSKPSIGNAG